MVVYRKLWFFLFFLTKPFSSTVTFEWQCRDSYTFRRLRYLKPDVHKKSKHKTAVIKKTLNPEFNEVAIPVCIMCACVELWQWEAHLQRLNVKRQLIYT